VASLEGELVADSESDRTGHVRLLVRLDDGVASVLAAD